MSNGKRKTSNERGSNRYNPRNNRGNRGRNNSRDYDSSNSPKQDTTRPGTNHAEWYNPDPIMYDLATRIPFGYRTGDPISIGGSTAIIPGCVTIDIVPTFGELIDRDSIGNVCGHYLATSMRTKNKGTPLAYDQCDIVAYLMALDSISMGMCYLQKVVKMAAMYSSQNKYYGNTLIAALGVNPNTLQDRLANVALRMNVIYSKLNSFYIPSFIPIFQRHAQMVSYLYTDETNMKAQLLTFRPAYLWKFTYNNEGRIVLQKIPFVEPGKKKNIDVYLAMLEDMLSVLFGNIDTLVTISGNMEATFGEGNRLNFASIAPTQELPLQAGDYGMLNQIHNIWHPHSWTFSDIEEQIVKTDTGELIAGYLTGSVTYSPANDNEYTKHLQRSAGNRFFDLHGVDITSDSIMRSTRLFGGQVKATASKTFELYDYGTEIVVDMAVLCFDATGLADTVSFTTYVGDITDAKKKNAVISGLYNVTSAPTLLDDSDTVVRIFSNTDQSTAIKTDDIAQLNQVAMMGLFSIDKIRSFIS